MSGDEVNVSVSLCTTCMGRLHHLRETLEKNITACGNSGFAEIVLLDYSSPDNLAGWIADNMLGAISEGLLVFYQAFGYEEFSRPHAKNVAHRLARGAIVCNLDADNIAGEGFPEYLIERFQGSEKLLVCPAVRQHTLTQCSHVWATDWTSHFKNRIPDGVPWDFTDYFSGQPRRIDPAIVHLMRCKKLLIRLGSQ